MNSIYDVIVIGLGSMGSSSLYYLSQNKNLKTLGLEQFDLVHSKGSYHGDTRIIRMVYPDGNYVPLLKQSYKEWSKLQDKAKEQLLFQVDYIILNITYYFLVWMLNNSANKNKYFKRC